VASAEKDRNVQMVNDLSAIASDLGTMKATVHQGADQKQAKEARTVVGLEVVLVGLGVLCGCSR
jgi:hypothetical protein